MSRTEVFIALLFSSSLASFGNNGHLSRRQVKTVVSILARARVEPSIISKQNTAFSRLNHTTMDNLSQPTTVERVRSALSSAAEYAWALQRHNGHWCGELKSNATITAEQILFTTSLGYGISEKDKISYRRYFLGEQQADGSWAVAPEYPGDISTSCEAYLALKILGMPTDSLEMRKARDFILSAGGVASVRIFTRIYFAQFGLFPWQATPELPAELILIPPSIPLNIFKFASWARSTVVPLLIICHHRPVYALPNGRSCNNDFLDELWLDPSDKMVPLPGHSDMYSFVFGSINTVLQWLGGLRWSPSRGYALRKCVDWILGRQEPNGDWAGIIPPMHFGVQALLLEGYSKEDDLIRRAVAAIDDFHWQDETGKRLQSCVSPVWDTALMLRGLCDAGTVPRDDTRLQSAAQCAGPATQRPSRRLARILLCTDTGRWLRIRVP